MPSTADFIEGFSLESIYISDASSGNLLGPDYEVPQCYLDEVKKRGTYSFHNCNRALFGILFNNIFVAHGKLNNDGGTGGPIYNGVATCEDFNNLHPNWPTTTNFGTPNKSRYSKKVISKTEAKDIANSVSDCRIRIKFESAIQPGQTICSGTSGPHADAAWFRIKSSRGDVIFNGCFTANQTLDLYILPLCLQMEFVTRSGTPPTTETRAVSAIVKGTFNNKQFYEVYDDQFGYANIGFIMWNQNRWEHWQNFPIQGTTRVPGGDFYGYNNDPSSPNFPIQGGTWISNSLSIATNNKKIISGVCGEACPIPSPKENCNCSGKIVDGSEKSEKEKRIEKIKKLKEIQDKSCKK